MTRSSRRHASGTSSNAHSGWAQGSTSSMSSSTSGVRRKGWRVEADRKPTSTFFFRIHSSTAS